MEVFFIQRDIRRPRNNLIYPVFVLLNPMYQLANDCTKNFGNESMHYFNFNTRARRY
ncbi:hypothetical protein AWB78_08697 [Caballeronia calidae]|uniref:Uncharacterized protein n=1 Tax=Caballeronia calidae TaxID=1777139 RepID=A0A158ELE8_9BURK|nr:hypothetical protein AWB78_08697 [Caballeronia calidae]